MVPRISLGKCTDVNISRLAEMYKAGKIGAGEAVVKGGKEYFVGPQVAYSHTTNAMGDVRKGYRLKRNGEWHLQDRQVSNERGTYSRRVNTLMGTTEDGVSLGHQQPFIRQDDGTYLQRAYSDYPARVATSKEIEAAIDISKVKVRLKTIQDF